MTETMDNASQALFGRFPRFVGNPKQFGVNSEDEFDLFVGSNDGRNNVYASISAATKSGTPVSDMVSLDFDSPMKEAAFGPDLRDDEKIDRMRDDPALVGTVLGPVLHDAKKVGKWAIDRSTPGVCVLTGFGIHVHLLYEPTVNAEDNLTSIAVRLKEELDLETIDRLPIGDTQRLVRVPNCRRMAGDRRCDHVMIPIRLRDIHRFDPIGLFELSTDPHYIEIYGIDEQRKPMPLFDDYIGSNNGHNDRSIHRQPIDDVSDDLEDEFLASYLEGLLKMPCLYERILQPDPSHMVRFASAIQLFNCGLSVDDVADIFSRLGWVDYDAEVTRKQIEQIYQKRYSAVSCETLRSHELCCFPVDDAESECPTFGWEGGLRNY